MNKNNKGSITVEASLIFIVFVSLLLVLLTVVKLNLIYAKVQYGINQVAKELASYSYLYAVSGIMELNNTLQNQIDNQTQTIDETAEAVLNIYYNLTGDSKSEGTKNFKLTIEDFKKVSSDTSTIIENVKQLAQDPKKLFTSLIYLGLDETLFQLKSKIAIAITEALIPNYIGSSIESLDIKLKKDGIVNGFNGLDFTGTSYLDDGESIEIVVKYQVEEKIPFFGTLVFNFEQKAKSKAWLLGDSNIPFNSLVNGSNSPENNIWHDTNYFRRGKRVISNEQQQHSYRILNIAGLHALNESNDSIEIIRIVSYDSNKPTNDLEQFVKIISNHFRIMTEKISSLVQLNIENIKTSERKLIGMGNNTKITKSIYVIVPEDISIKEMDKMNEHIKQVMKNYQYLNIYIKKGYGTSKVSGE